MPLLLLGPCIKVFEFDQCSSFSFPSETVTPDEFSLQQYTMAIGQLVRPAQNGQKQTADIALMACVLFICFEVGSILIGRAPFLLFESV
jgi:hypothetical protein